MITIDADPDKTPDSADFRLMSNRAVHALLKYSERNLFLRGLVPQLGFQAGKVYYQRTARLAGETKHPFKKWLVWRSMELRH
ncbi:hypothetical protein ACLUX0_03390 [Limosilactobacillus mucosae]